MAARERSPQTGGCSDPIPDKRHREQSRARTLRKPGVCAVALTVVLIAGLVRPAPQALAAAPREGPSVTKFMRAVAPGQAKKSATPSPTPTATAVSSSTPTPTAAAVSLALGAYISGAPWDPSKIDDFTRLVGTSPSIVMWYQDWAHVGVKEFDRAKLDAVVGRGAMPMISWEPWDYTLGVSQPDYALRTIVAGLHDAYIREWARAAASWGGTVYLRFAYEMNGNWRSWSPGVNGNTSAEYTAAWQHVIDIFRQEQARNVRWVWSPNVATSGATPFADLYPGDAYVDWLGLDGYNWGTTAPWSTWTSLVDLFRPSAEALSRLSTKPLMIAETASTEQGGDKAAWIRQGLLNGLPAELPQVRAVVWFHEQKETSWHVDSSTTSLAAYREVAADARYKGRLP